MQQHLIQDTVDNANTETLERETIAEQTARLKGFAQGRLIRATRFGERDRKCGRPENCPDEFRLQETREAYRDAYKRKG